MKKLIIKIDEMTFTDIVISKGNEYCCIYAKVRFPGVRPINITYDCIGRNLIVHEWYLLDKNVIDEIYREFFVLLSMVAGQSI